MKTRFGRLLIFVYLILVLFTVLLILRPGSSIFYIKKNIVNEVVQQESGYTNLYLVEHSKFISPISDILLYENDHLLKRATSTQVQEIGEGPDALIEVKDHRPVYESHARNGCGHRRREPPVGQAGLIRHDDYDFPRRDHVGG